jgi:hypothetical protein
MMGLNAFNAWRVLQKCTLLHDLLADEQLQIQKKHKDIWGSPLLQLLLLLDLYKLSFYYAVSAQSVVAIKK